MVVHLYYAGAVAVHSRCETAEVINGSFVFFGMESPGDPELMERHGCGQSSKQLFCGSSKNDGALVETWVSGAENPLRSGGGFCQCTLPDFCETRLIYRTTGDPGVPQTNAGHRTVLKGLVQFEVCVG